MHYWLGLEGDELRWAFRRVFGVHGREFGSPAIRLGGLSDGNEGVQWNAWIDRERREDWAGVNLEGMKYDGWPVARLIRRELKEPTLPTLARSIEGADRIVVLWARDFWQVTARPRIVESDIHPTPKRLSQLSEEDWRRALEGALACLDETRNYQGRATQQVTVISKQGRTSRTGPVSPHLKLKVALEGDHSWESFLHETKLRMRPLYDWVAERTKPEP